MAISRLAVTSAKLLYDKTHVLPGKLLVTELFFQVPLDYSQTSTERDTITLFARSVVKHEVPICRDGEICSPTASPTGKPYLVYLEGGPGFGNREPQDHPLTPLALARGYHLLLLDHRGVGLSTPVSARMLDMMPGGVDGKAKYLGLMRQDNTVRDCEAVRKCLNGHLSGDKARWSIFGQSYGGFVALSYLSMYPEGLREVFLTGGLAPVGKAPDEVYQVTFRRTLERNKAYYTKFPEDVETVRKLAAHIEGEGGSIDMPAGGKLTVPRLLTMGIAFGGHGGFDTVHSALLNLKTSLRQFGFFTRAALASIESFTPFDTNIIYAILHEAIYCDGPGSASNWSAYHVGQALAAFDWLRPGFSVAASEGPLNFSGEMIFPLHFETYPELAALRDVAERLAQRDDWPALYDRDVLAENSVPVYAASFIDDMYVDYDFARDTARLVKGTMTFDTNAMYHTALRAKSEEVLQHLFNLRDDVLD